MTNPVAMAEKARLERIAGGAAPRADALLTLRLPGKKPVQMMRGDLVRLAMSMQIARRVMELIPIHRTDENREVRLEHQWIDVYADPSPDMRIVAASQRGKTLYEIIKTMAQVDLGLSVGWVMPKHEKVKELIQGKLDRTLSNTPYYSMLQQMAEGGADGIKLKMFGRTGRLYCVASQSADDLTSFTADAMHVDERDFCNQKNLPMYTSRMNFSPYKLTDEISTCTTPGAEPSKLTSVPNNIISEFLAGDQHRYFSLCTHCGLWQILDFYENLIIAQQDDAGNITDFQIRDQDWSPGDHRDIRVCCANPKCGRPFDRLAQGKWRALKPERQMRSRWMEPLASGVGHTMKKLVSLFEGGLHNPSKMQQFHNMDLARPYTGGMKRFDERLFTKCTVPHFYALTENSEWDGPPTTIGIDVNRPFIDIQVSAWRNGRALKIFAGKMLGDIPKLISMLKRFRVRGGVIDDQPEMNWALEIQRKVLAKLGVTLTRCQYSSNTDADKIKIKEEGDRTFDPPKLVIVNKTQWIDDIFGVMQACEMGWFCNWQTVLEGQMFAEMSTPTRTLVRTDEGNERWAWTGTPDHQLQACVYDRIAGHLLGLTMGGYGGEDDDVVIGKSRATGTPAQDFVPVIMMG